MKKADKEQTFVFEVKIKMVARSNDYDATMKKIMDEVNNLNGGEVEIKEMKGEHPIWSI